MRPKIIEYLYQHDIIVYVPAYKDLYIAMIIIAVALSTILAAKKGLPAIKFYISTLLIFSVSFLGGRIYFELRNTDHIISNSFISDIILGVGTESIGVYIGGIIGAFIVLKWMRIDMLTAFDVYAPVLALSLSIGRIGCFMGGCCFGRTTILPWGVSFPRDSPAYISQLKAGLITSDFNHTLPVHPTQIYEVVFGIALFIFLLWSERNRRIDGFLLFIYLISYAVFRFFIEFLRGDDRGNFLSLSYPQIFAILLFIFGITAMVFVNKKVNQKMKK